MECRALARAGTEQRVTLDIHLFGPRLDPAVANPGRVAGDDIEPTFGKDMREMNVEREEIE